MTTLEPGSTGARSIVIPRPVIATQERFDSAAESCLVKIGTTISSQATISSAKPPSWPFTGVPSDIVAAGRFGRIEASLTVGATAAQAVEAFAALAGDRHDDAIATLHALHLWPDFLDDGDGAMTEDLRVGDRHRRVERVDERVTRLRRLDARDDLPRVNRIERQLLDVEARAVANQRPEFPSRRCRAPACEDGWRLSLRGRLRKGRIATRQWRLFRR
jgi:hypothetical protein